MSKKQTFVKEVEVDGEPRTLRIKAHAERDASALAKSIEKGRGSWWDFLTGAFVRRSR